jgi:hypothetical protein
VATTTQLEQVLKFIEGNAPEAKVRASSTSKIVLESEIDRSDIKKKLQDNLTAAGIKFEEGIISGSSFPATKLKEYSISVLYKNIKGGMTETTLNSSITELFPCIAFVTNIEKTRDVNEFYSNIIKNNKKNLSCYLGEDWKKGQEYVDKAEVSTKFKQKVTGAMAVYKFILDQHAGKPIKNVYWGFRAKPPGVSSNHKGDIFIEYNDSKKLGASIKSGGENTAEPKFNSFVKPVMEKFGKADVFEQLKKEIHDKFYIGIPAMPIDYKKFGSKEFKEALSNLEAKAASDYNKRYDDMLVYVRGKLIEMFNKNQDLTKRWLVETVAGDQPDVPLVVVKAIETSGEYEIKNDDDILKSCVIRSKKQNGLLAVPSPTSKQNFDINLTCNKKTTVLQFSIRTNKPGVDHKLGQGANLAVKFNGVKK